MFLAWLPDNMTRQMGIGLSTGPKRFISCTSKLRAISSFSSSSAEISVGIPLITTLSWRSAAREKVWNSILLASRTFWISRNCVAHEVLTYILPSEEDLAVRPIGEMS